MHTPSSNPVATETRTTCCYCGVGCGVIVSTEGGRVTAVRGDPDHPANFGRLCTKGATLHLTTGHGARAHVPELRHERGRPRERVLWDDALDHAAERFAAIIREHGPDSVAFYLSGQLLTEDYYVFNKLAKGLVGTNNVDTNSRLCMSSAVTGYKATLGADAPPSCYEDLDHAECVFIAGANPAYAHPVLFRRLEEARKHRAQQWIVVDPRVTDTAAAADLHLQIRAGTDVALFHGMLHVMLVDGLVNRSYIAKHTSGFADLVRIVEGWTPAVAAATCGIPVRALERAARMFARSPATLSLYCQGLNQSANGTAKNAALINLHLATGQIGRPGSGPFSLTGQPNAMGGREVGGLATLGSAHRDLANPEHRAETARLWGVDSVPAVPGKTAVELFDALADGSVKAVWIACTNPAYSLPNLANVRRGLERAEFVVLQEAYADTETAPYADLLLPATSWAEKEGTVTNSERRISRVRAAVAGPGEARADWVIATDFARRLAAKLDRADDGARLFPYANPEQVFDEHRETTRGRDLDITGLSYAMLAAAGPQQWPLPEGAASGATRLYADGRYPTADGRARFAALDYVAAAEPADTDYPLVLNTGRLRDQWHGMSRTGTVARLFNHAPEPVISLHAQDLAARGLKDGDLATVDSRRGRLTLRVQAAADVAPGEAFIPMHWGGAFVAGDGVNALTLPAFDPVSKQPELKAAAIQVARAELPWQLVALAAVPEDDAALEAIVRGARACLDRFPFATLALAGRDLPLVVFQAAAAMPADEATLAALDAAFGLDDADRCFAYMDFTRGISKRARFDGPRIGAVRFAGDTCARTWVQEAMAAGADTEALRRWVLAPVASPPQALPARGRIVCNCYDVAEGEIRGCVAGKGADLSVLQQTLKCGTSCGSCLPELKRLVAQHTESGVRTA